MKKLLLSIFFLLNASYAFCQDSTYNTVLIEPERDTINKYIKIEDRISYRYPSFKYEDDYIKLSIKNNIIIISQINDSGKTIIEYQNIPYIDEYSYSIIADSMKKSEIDYQMLGEDSTFPVTTILQSIRTIKNGYYKEYYPNGNIKIKGQYNKGIKSGKWKFYNIDGKLECKEKWKMDVVIKKCKK